MNRYFLIVFAVAVFVLGFVCGMIFQQIAIKNMAIDVVRNIEGVEINVDINETQILEGTREIAEYMIKEINNSQNQGSVGE